MNDTPRLADLPLAAGTEPESVPALTNPADFDTASRVVDRVRAWAADRPDRPAIVTGETTLSYGQLAELIEQTSALLRASGCAAGDVVACHGPRAAYSPILFLALESLGAIYLPVDPDWPSARISEVLELSGSVFLVDYAASVADLPAVKVLKDRSDLVVWGAESEPRYVIYTSGTTGRPKGAIVCQAGMMNHLWAKVADLGLTEEDRVAFTAPLVFDISVWQMLVPLAIGGTVVVAAENDILFPPRLHRLLLRHEVSVLELVPTAIGTLLDEATRRTPNRVLPALRWLISTGEELRPSLAGRALTALPHAKLLNAYGPTECSDDVTHHVVSVADTVRSRLPVGYPIGNAKLYCLTYQADEGTWAATEPGEVGEIFVGGIPVGLGYLGDSTATLAAFFRDTLDPDSPTGRLYRTGDLGRIDEDGVHYLGRVDRQVKVAGVRMELDEIEAILSRHPAVRQCAVTVSRENGHRELLAAHYVPQEPVTTEELEEFVRAALPAGLVPRRWVRLDALPLTPNGKLDYRALA